MITLESDVSPRDAMEPLILSLDVGTSSVRALVYDRRGLAVRGYEVHKPYAITTTPDGGVFVDAHLLFDLTVACMDDMHHLVARHGRTIEAVACDTFWHSMLAIDDRGEAISPVLTWADTRSAVAANQLESRLAGESVHARTGAVLHSSYWPAKLVWMRDHDPHLAARASSWISFGEYLYFRLFGDRRVSISMASATGLFDQKDCTWDKVMLDAAGITADQLFRVADFTEVARNLRPQFAHSWPELAQIPWFLPIGDGAASNVGSGGATDETAVVMVGTSGALRVVRSASTFAVPEGLWSYRVDRRRVVQGAALSAGGNVMAWASQTLQLKDLSAIEKQIDGLQPDGHGLTVLPFLAGERSPDWNINARSAIVGATLHTNSADIVQALLEAVTYRFGLVFSILEREIPSVRAIIGSGAGLVHSPTWTQMMADVLEHPIHLSGVQEASSRGGALLALEHLGALEDASKVPAPVQIVCSPVDEHTAIYRRAMNRQQELYERLLR